MFPYSGQLSLKATTTYDLYHTRGSIVHIIDFVWQMTRRIHPPRRKSARLAVVTGPMLLSRLT